MSYLFWSEIICAEYIIRFSCLYFFYEPFENWGEGGICHDLHVGWCLESPDQQGVLCEWRGQAWQRIAGNLGLNHVRF